jgi:hypothetical protein
VVLSKDSIVWLEGARSPQKYTKINETFLENQQIHMVDLAIAKLYINDFDLATKILSDVAFNILFKHYVLDTGLAHKY